MIEIRWVMLVTVALTAGVMLALPHLTPRGIFFGVRTGEEFRRSEAGRSALSRYRLWVLLAAAVGVALVIAAGQSATILIAGSVGPELICLAAFVRNYLALKPYALPPDRLREADLADGAEGIPWWALLAAPPFALPLAAMLYLREHWNQIPARYPIHFGADGQANGWMEKSARAVYAPLWFAEGLLVLMLLLGAAILLGSRRSARQVGIPQIFVAVMYLIATVFSLIGLTPLVHLPPLAIVAAVAVFVLGLLVYGFRRLSRPGAPVETTPDEYWTLGGIYRNPNDPALFVQKRIGYGFTVNFGNPWSWVVMGGFFAGVCGLTAFLIWAQRL